MSNQINSKSCIPVGAVVWIIALQQRRVSLPFHYELFHPRTGEAWAIRTKWSLLYLLCKRESETHKNKKRSSVLWSQKRPMSPQGVRVRGDAKFLLSQCLRSSSQLKWERRETSHQCFRVWFKNHTDVCNGAITPHSILLGLFCRCWSALETLCAGSAGAEGKGLERCADSLSACSPGMSEGTQRIVNQRHSAASSYPVGSILSVLMLSFLNILQVHLSGIAYKT